MFQMNEGGSRKDGEIVEPYNGFLSGNVILLSRDDVCR
ncbi:hypothetical protein YPPY66_4474 [Yersinia pestis PY-66]|uniref:Uncharacterized protein n=2 Tax=Yersinia pseudotuberculosis complex TaxID=1649845 RepID=A0A0U1QZU1_YERP3|nr:hypothetical protein YpsIP31758_0373 [Yersinia pseudotuberculosis IP 31758]EDR37766.1 hypothetical protein YpF1991016_2385 [Yersinia pestis biovar Orientalis str. F1991016]EDR49117.1 hypothetical protein YpB42003004_0555 [Yersinia pestis biovar Antiqua str. B42003004]EDR57448.1 hypothetical protein YpMG051020_4075 [Yersinia pestis biovar Orientalis str. MG05-1020]EDR65283.1 hypothetical protein YpK1973002_3095 [Yersinia pestis biovar Mediaevalis str. K1973002]EEO74414.1 hypothetical protein